jgi:thiosulfate reductase/polysulfide reductase chain A
MTATRHSRRRFLKAAAATSAGAALLRPQRAEAFSLARIDSALPADREVPTYCELCFWNCGVVAHARGNRVLELRGHPDYPTSQGKLCGRGNAGAASVVDGDRLRHPMLRVGARGEGKFERIGWREAYQRIAAGFDQIRKSYGAEALALFYHGSGGPLLRSMLVAYGSPNYAGPSYAQCKGARNVGYKLTFGEKFPSPEPLDFDHARAIVLFGSHLGENAHNSQLQEFLRAKKRGARVVVLDPRLSTVASRADVWLPLRPGSDLAVILAWIHLLVADDAYDHDFVDANCIGLAELKAHVAPFTPAWAAAEAGVREDAIREAYAILRTSMPAVVVHPGRHVSWYGEADTQRARGQAILSALLGAWWTPGSTYRPESPSLGDYPGPDYPELPPDVDKAAGRFPFAQEVTTNGIREATRSGRPYPIKGWFVHGTNLIQAMPNVAETLEAIRQLDLLVVCDILPTEITRWADIILPEDTYLERYDDILAGSGLRPFVGLRQPVVKSPHDTRPAWRIAKELGAELGVGDFFAWASFEEYLDARLAGTGTTVSELQSKGIHFVERKTPAFRNAGEAIEFHTPSGKVELFSRQLAEKGFDPLPTYRPQPSPPRGSFRLLYGRSPLHTFGRTQNNPILHEVAPSNDLWMHPSSAASLGLEDGAMVEARNARGDTTGALPLRVTERIPEDAVYMVHGFGHRARELSRAFGRGGDDTAVITDYAVDPISGSTAMRTQFVTVHAAGVTQ